MASVSEREAVVTQWIHMASDEWGCNLMDAVADEAFGKYEGDKSKLLVEVHEHGGWYLAYAWIDGRVRVVSSANDAACFPKEVSEFWRMYNKASRTMLPTIRRGQINERQA
jgi:hypothetical protein